MTNSSNVYSGLNASGVVIDKDLETTLKCLNLHFAQLFSYTSILQPERIESVTDDLDKTHLIYKDDTKLSKLNDSIVVAFVYGVFDYINQYVKDIIPQDKCAFRSTQGIVSLILRFNNIYSLNLSNYDVSESMLSSILTKTIHPNAAFKLIINSNMIKQYAMFSWWIKSFLFENEVYHIDKVMAGASKCIIDAAAQTQIVNHRATGNILKLLINENYSNYHPLPKAIEDIWQPFQYQVDLNKVNMISLLDTNKIKLDSFVEHISTNAEIMNNIWRCAFNDKIQTIQNLKVKHVIMNCNRIDVLNLFALISGTWYNSGWLDGLLRIKKSEKNISAAVKSIKDAGSYYKFISDRNQKIISRIYGLPNIEYLMFLQWDDEEIQRAYYKVIIEIISIIQYIFSDIQFFKDASTILSLPLRTPFELEEKFGYYIYKYFISNISIFSNEGLVMHHHERNKGKFCDMLLCSPMLGL